MPLSFLTRDVFDLLIIIVMIVGLVLTGLRLRADLTRPLPDDETDPNKPV